MKRQLTSRERILRSYGSVGSRAMVVAKTKTPENADPKTIPPPHTHTHTHTHTHPFFSYFILFGREFADDLPLHFFKIIAICYFLYSFS